MAWAAALSNLEASGIRGGNTGLKLMLTTGRRTERILATAFELWLLLGTIAMWHFPYHGTNAVIGFWNHLERANLAPACETCFRCEPVG